MIRLSCEILLTGFAQSSVSTRTTRDDSRRAPRRAFRSLHRLLSANIALSAVLCAVIASAVSAAIWITYYQYQPLWVEHAAYGITANVTFADALATRGYWGAVWSVLGDRHPLQPAVLASFSPRLLSWPHSHLLITSLTFCVFLCLLAHYASRRTSHPYWGGAAAVLFCSLTGLYDERQGMGVPWPDYQSMFLLSSAVLALALYAIEGTVRWLLAAGASIVLATLARDTGAIWSASVCGPIAVMLFVVDIRRYGLRRALARALLFVAATAPAAILFARHLAFFQSYYMTANQWQLRQPLGTAAGHMANDLFLFFGPAAALLVCGLIVCSIWFAPAGRWEIADAAIVYWPTSIVLFLFANGYAASDVTKEIMYAAPGIVGAAMTVRGGPDVRSRAWAQTVISAALTVCVVVAGAEAVAAYQRARTPTPGDVKLRASQQALADVLASFRRRVWWHSYSMYDWATPVAALTHFDGHYQPNENQWFHNHKNYWDSRFPGMNITQLQAFVIRQTDERVDVAVVLKRPDVKPDGMEDYSFTIASSVAAHVQSSLEWRHYRDVETVEGPLAFFVNLRRLGGVERATGRLDPSRE
jgi:hypothetical protein